MSIVPRPYQLEAIEAAYPHDGYALFMQQRTGKTLTALWLSERWNCHKNLVVCPKKAIPIWKKEIKSLGLDSSKFTVVNFESFRINKSNYIYQVWDLVIIDESHRIKERGSQQTKAIWRLSGRTLKRLILTGSPQGNGMEDYYAQLKFIRPDLFTTWKDFSGRYLVVEDVTLPGREDPFPKIVGYKNQEEFQRILLSISHRVTRDEVAKVKTLVRNKRIIVPWEEESRNFYLKMENEYFIELPSGTLVTGAMALTRAGKLHQICGGYAKDENGDTHHIHNTKLSRLWQLMDTELHGESVAIVANYKSEMDAISEGLKERGIKYVQVRGKHQYDPNDRSQVTILNPSAGEAINLAHHTTMVIYSMNYSYLKWEQFKDRIVLVDTPMVKYYYLLMEDSMDLVVYNSVIEKKRLSEVVMEVYKIKKKQYKVPFTT